MHIPPSPHPNNIWGALLEAATGQTLHRLPSLLLFSLLYDEGHT